MKIVNIKKIGKNKYEIELADKRKIETFDTVMLNNKLLLKKEISEDLLEQIEQENKYAEVYEKILNFINKKLRNKSEVKEQLNKYDISIIEKENIIKKLEEQNYFDELSYIRAFIHDKIKFSNDGPAKIKKDLLNMEFDIKNIESELEKINDFEIEEKISKIISKKINQNHKYSEAYLKQKIMNETLKLGYSKETIESQLDKIKMNDNEILKQEAKKLLSKYKNKKSEAELYYFVKHKLYQKGYKIDEISFVIDSLAQEKD